MDKRIVYINKNITINNFEYLFNAAYLIRNNQKCLFGSSENFITSIETKNNCTLKRDFRKLIGKLSI